MKRNKKRRGCIHTIIALVCVMCIGMAAIVFLCNTGLGSGMVRKIEDELKKPQKIPYQEAEIAEEAFANKYYYQQLGEEDRQAYKEILQGVQENLSEIYIHASDADRANGLFQYVLKDCPEIFWCDGTATATSYDGKEPYTVLKPVYAYDEASKTAMQEVIEASVAECLSGISAGDTEYQKILYVYEYIVNTVDYDMEASDNQNIYSVFGNHRSVCAGYSKATQYLLERLGIFCTYVTGTTSSGQNHAWNLVMCDGDYYYVDTTWGDPLFQAAEGEEVNQQQNISYDYMCCDDTELLKNHTPDEDVKLPVCTKMDRNYYVMNGMYYDTYDSNTVLQKMNEVISDRGNPVVLKFADSGVYGQAHDDVFQNVVKSAAQNLAEWYGLTEVKYQYMDDPELNKITIYWQYE